ncbi:MAG: alpha/beta fold hydrolase [Clostridia bacterium]|nr:alpha/beta fold hydrolase [Clostridia bacterium]NCC69377.1 alpha/beta fold hydrolase [Clostridia bacterium]
MDINLYYTEEGEGFPLVLVHGNSESSVYFKHQIGFFSKYFRVIAVDTRGHGRSPRGSAPFTLSQFAADLKEFLDGLGIEKAHILGFSDGGNIALLFALSHPEMVGKLIVNGADLNTRGVKTSVQIPIELGYRAASLLSRFDFRALPKKEMLGLMVGQPNITPEELAALNMPVLVIAGTHDMIKDSHTRKIAGSIPGAELYLIEGGHFIARKSPAAFNARVLKFLK